MNWPIVGLEPLAIAFSLTYALLMWSCVYFYILCPLNGTHMFKQRLELLHCSVDI
jgi:hypothetical protein